MLRVTLALLLAAVATTASEAQRPRNVTGPSLKVQAALRRGGLHEAARVSGGFFKTWGNAMPDLYISDLVQVVGWSDAVVVGEPTSSKSHLSKDGSYITTDFRVIAQQVLMGDIPSGREIVVSVQGGRFQFADGLAAEIEMLDLAPPEHGGRVVMMLSRNTWASDELVAWTNGAPLYSPALGPLGMYTVGSRNSSRITLHSDATQPVLSAHQFDSTGSFLRSVDAAIATVNREKLAGRRR